jgi:hypothetical protein
VNLRIEPLFILKRTHPASLCLCLLLRVTSAAVPLPLTRRCLYRLLPPLRQRPVPCLVQRLLPLPPHRCSRAPQHLLLLLLLLLLLPLLLLPLLLLLLPLLLLLLLKSFLENLVV